MYLRYIENGDVVVATVQVLPKTFSVYTLKTLIPHSDYHNLKFECSWNGALYLRDFTVYLLLNCTEIATQEGYLMTLTYQWFVRLRYTSPLGFLFIITNFSNLVSNDPVVISFYYFKK